MFTTGNIVVLAISLLLTLVLRRFDRSRMQLSKIKKYSDRIISEYEALARQKEREFRDTTIELDLLLKKARIALQTTDGSLENVRKLVGEIDARKDELAEIARSASSTEESAREIRKLSANLARDEAGIRKLVTQVEGSKTAIAELEKRVPALEKTFHQKIEERIAGWSREIEARELPRIEKHMEDARERLVLELRETGDRARNEIQAKIGEGLGSAELLAAKTREIDSKLRDFVKDSRLFDRADKMIERLNGEIAALFKQIEKFGEEKKAVAELEKRLGSVRDERNAVETLFTRLIERKKELQAIENHTAAIGGEIARIETGLERQQPVFEQTRSMIESMQNELATLGEGLRRTEDLRGELDGLQEKEDEVRRLLDGISGDKKSLITLENRIATMSTSVVTLEQNLVQHQTAMDRQAATIDDKLRDFTDRSKIFERAERLAVQLEEEVDELDNRVAAVREEKAKLVTLRDDIAAVRADEPAIRAMLATIEQSRGNISDVESRVGRVGEIINQFETLVEKKRQSVEASFDKDKDRIRGEIARLEENIGTIREKAVQTTKNSVAGLQTDLKDIDRRIKAFTKETALFERADKLSGKLTEDIAQLNSRISQLRVDKKDLLDLGKQIEDIRREEQEIARIANTISGDKKELAALEKRMQELARLSESVEGRLQTVSKAAGVIQPVETRLHALAQTQDRVQKQLDELAVKDSKLGQSHARFKKAEAFADKLESQLEILRNNFETVQQEKANLGRHVEELQEKSKKLLENEVRVNKLVSHFDQMDGLLSDVEKRTSQLAIAQDRLGKMESSIKELSGQADVRIEDLSALSRKIDAFFGTTPSPAPARGGKQATATKQEPATGNRNENERRLNEMIFKMHDQGMDAGQIARIVKQPISDVELRLHVRKD